MPIEVKIQIETPLYCCQWLEGARKTRTIDVIVVLKLKPSWFLLKIKWCKRIVNAYNYTFQSEHSINIDEFIIK